MNILMISPGFPAEMPEFTRGLAEVGARAIGVGEHPPAALPELARRSLADYLQVGSLFDEETVIRRAREVARRVPIDRVECLWEPCMLLAARLREALGLPGMTLAETVPFRNKEQMKRVLDRAGLRTPRHADATSEHAVRTAAEAFGYPLVIKPIAGAGSAHTHRVDNLGELEQVLAQIRHVPHVSVEEYVDGEEYTFDTVCAGGEILYENIAWYRPKPIIGRNVEWISPQTVNLRNIERPELQAGRRLGRAVLAALGFRTGFTHMEWFLRADGEAVFGEIGARPPGARSVDLMNYTNDFDVYRGWAEAVCHRRFSEPVQRRYNAAVIFKRARGAGRIRRIEGLEALRARYGASIVAVDLLPIGAARRNWRQTLLSDGYLIVRHPELAKTLEMADRVGTDLQIEAG